VSHASWLQCIRNQDAAADGISVIGRTPCQMESPPLVLSNPRADCHPDNQANRAEDLSFCRSRPRSARCAESSFSMLLSNSRAIRAVNEFFRPPDCKAATSDFCRDICCRLSSTCRSATARRLFAIACSSNSDWCCGKSCRGGRSHLLLATA